MGRAATSRLVDVAKHRAAPAPVQSDMHRWQLQRWLTLARGLMRQSWEVPLSNDLWLTSSGCSRNKPFLGHKPQSCSRNKRVALLRGHTMMERSRTLCSQDSVSALCRLTWLSGQSVVSKVPWRAPLRPAADGTSHPPG